MAKELPYFKFEPNAWENGNIQMLSREDKGLFIDVCSMYWSRLGDLPCKLVIQKLCGGDNDAINNLVEEGIIQIKNNNIQICFLDKQLNEFNIQSKVNSNNAKSRWENVPERMKGNIVYVIRCWNDTEEFIKIGITTTSISRRFSGKLPYNYEVLVVDYYESIELESQYKEVAKDYEYTTTENFSGYYECYKIEAMSSIMQFAKIRNAKYMRNVCETDAIREEKRREKKIISTPDGDTPKSFKKFSKEDFHADVKKYLDKYGKDTCRDFFNYWTEPDAAGKMKFQLQKTWSTSGRLATWLKNESKFGNKPEKQVNTDTKYYGPQYV